MHKLARILIITGLLLPLLLTPQSAQACTCDLAIVVMEWRPPAESFAKSAAVFEGQVIRWDAPHRVEHHLYRYWSFYTHGYPHIRSLTEPLIRALANPNPAVVFEVKRSWKGVGYKQIEVTTRSCGTNLFVGETYLVYGFLDSNSRLTSDGCFQSKAVDFAEPDLNYLESQPTIPLIPSPFQLGRWLCLTAPLLLIIGAFFIGRQKRYSYSL